MVILEEVEIKLEFSDMDRRVALPRLAAPDGFVAQHPRSAGVHMSGILKPLAISARKLKETEQLEEEYPLLWAMGVAWEEFCASFMSEADYQPGSICKDGIWMTCDAISVPDTIAGQPNTECRPVIEEMKYTTKSMRCSFPELAKAANAKLWQDEWMWLMQGKAYCVGYGAQIVRWHVLYSRGDYKVFGPRYVRYTCEFTEQELKQAWQMFVANKALAVPEGGQ